MFETVLCGTDRWCTDDLCGAAQTLDGGADGVVADAVEARLQTRLRARHEMIADLVVVEVANAPRGVVGVLMVESGGARADGAVHAEVAGQPEHGVAARQLDRHRIGQFAPVADDAQPELVSRRTDAGEVLDRSEVRAAEIVHGADTELDAPL